MEKEECCPENKQGKKKFHKIVKSIKDRSNRRDIIQEMYQQDNKWNYMQHHPGVFTITGAINMFPSTTLPNGTLKQNYNSVQMPNFNYFFGYSSYINLQVPYIVSFTITGNASSMMRVGIGIKDAYSAGSALLDTSTAASGIISNNWGNSVYLTTNLDSSSLKNDNWYATTVNVSNNNVVSNTTGSSEFVPNGINGKTVYTIRETVRGQMKFSIWDGVSNLIPKYADFANSNLPGNARYLFSVITNAGAANPTFNYTIDIVPTPESLQQY